MRIQKGYKPTHHRANARYRGVTEHAQYTNFVLESAHDLLLLSQIKTGEEKVAKAGHEKEIHQNFISVMNGDGDVGKTNLFTASTMQKIDRNRTVQVPALGSWDLLNGCVRTVSGAGFKLASNGLKDPVGAYSRLYVEPGDRVYLRMKVRSTSGAADFTFGSNNMRIAPGVTGNTKKISLPANGEFVYVDHTLQFGYPETVNLNINVHQKPSVLKAADIEVRDLEVFYIEETPISVASYHTVIKPALDEIEEKINSIR